MRRFAVLGNPIAHSKSPEIHQAFAAGLNHEVDYSRILVEPGDFNAVVTEFFSAGGIGLNVTAPFKGDAFEIAEVRTDAAVDAKAANTLWLDSDTRICAHTTDGSGSFIAEAAMLNSTWSLTEALCLACNLTAAQRRF